MSSRLLAEAAVFAAELEVGGVCAAAVTFVAPRPAISITVNVSTTSHEYLRFIPVSLPVRLDSVVRLFCLRHREASLAKRQALCSTTRAILVCFHLSCQEERRSDAEIGA